MTRIHLPGLPQWRCVICDAPTDQRHHLTYAYAPEDEALVLVPLCEDHHARLHCAHDATDRRLALGVLSAQFIADPERAEALARIVPASLIAAQLTFADQATPQGEHWRTVEAGWAELWEEYGQDEAA